MTEFGDLDGRFDFFAVVTPDGKIPTLEDHTKLNDPAEWYTSPDSLDITPVDYALVFTDWDDANADYQQHRENLPAGTRIRAFSVVVEEIENIFDDSKISRTDGQRTGGAEACRQGRFRDPFHLGGRRQLRRGGLLRTDNARPTSPRHRPIVLASGVIEVVLGILLRFRDFRGWRHGA